MGGGLSGLDGRRVDDRAAGPHVRNRSLREDDRGVYVRPESSVPLLVPKYD